MTGPVPAIVEPATARNRPKAPRLWLGALAALVVAVGWFLLALTHPTTTYHLDPLLVVIAPVAITRLRSTGALSWRIVWAGCGIGAGLALATTILLGSVGALRGPSLFGSISPVAEAVIAILLGLAVVVVSSLIRQTRNAR